MSPAEGSLASDSESMPGQRRLAELADRLERRWPAVGSNLLGLEVPLRICPLGAHIDHQDGIVTGLAVDRSVLMAAFPVEGPTVEVESIGFDGTVTADVTVKPSGPKGNWGDYVRAALTVLQENARLSRGVRAVIQGELPGAGLSSSAAVLLAYIAAFAEANGLELEANEMAALVQRAENTYIGVASGLLDQSIMVHAERGSLTRVDCLSLAVDQIGAPPAVDPVTVIVAFSGAGRSLADSGYNNRVLECREAAGNLVRMSGGTPAAEPRLRDVDPELFVEFGHRLPRDQRLRAIHYFEEMERVALGVEAWRSGDRCMFGELVTASGESSIVNYECGTPELTRLFELLRDEPGVLGTRFSGGGFGGTCIALAEPDACAEIVAAVSARYSEACPDPARSAIFEICRPAGPLRVFEVER